MSATRSWKLPIPLHSNDRTLQLVSTRKENALSAARMSDRPRAESDDTASTVTRTSSDAVREVVTTASTLADMYINELLDRPLTAEESAPSFTRKFERLAREVERRHVAQYDEMCKSLIIDGRTVYPIFSQIADELFKSGVNWGRIVGLYAFAGSLCKACVNKGMVWTVDAVKGWVVAYVRSNLATWIVEHGGWVSVVSVSMLWSYLFVFMPFSLFNWTDWNVLGL